MKANLNYIKTESTTIDSYTSNVFSSKGGTVGPSSIQSRRGIAIANESKRRVNVET